MNNSVRNLQSALRKISEYNPVIPTVIPDGKFGNQTETAVREFQKEYGISETGIVDYKTHKKIYEVYNGILKNEEEPYKLQGADAYSLPVMKGASGSTVIFIQAMLSGMGVYPRDKINGIFDDETENAVKEVQKIWGIPETGMVDKKTWNALAGYSL